MSARNIQCQASQDSQVRRSVVFSRPGEILVEDNVERPVQSILYAPMLTHDAKKFGRLVAARQQEVAFDLFVATTFAFDPRHPLQSVGPGARTVNREQRTGYRYERTSNRSIRAELVTPAARTNGDQTVPFAKAQRVSSWTPRKVGNELTICD